MKKFIAMLLMGAVLVTSALSVGCGDDKAKKDTKPATPAKTDGDKKTP